MLRIGIDPGTHTGLAVWDGKEFLALQTLPIHVAMDEVDQWSRVDQDVMVIFEDARLRRWFGRESNEKLQGAGSVKRDCSIWEDFLTDRKIPFQAIHPVARATKLSPDSFRCITGYTGRTSEHSRDAGMLVFGR